MSHREAKGTSAPNRRSHPRESVDDKVRIKIETSQLDGIANNLSKSGILFFTDDELRVTIEVNDADGPKTYTGSLVRCERINGNHRGWAVEFD